MKSLACILSLLLLSAMNAKAEEVVILENDFERPSEITYHYPSPASELYGRHENIGGWSLNGGVIAVSYIGGVGVDRSGGLLANVYESSDRYMVISCFDLRLPFTALDTFQKAQAQSLSVEFSASIPAGRDVQVVFAPEMPADMKNRDWSSRLIFGTVRGTGQYTHYVLSGTKAEVRSLDQFSQFVRDAALNGMSKVTGALTFSLVPASQWAKGESLQLDNIVFKMSR